MMEHSSSYRFIKLNGHSIHTHTENMFVFFLANSVTKREFKKQLVYFYHQIVYSLCLHPRYVNSLCVSVEFQKQDFKANSRHVFLGQFCKHLL